MGSHFALVSDDRLTVTVLQIAVVETDQGKLARIYDVPQPNQPGRMEANRLLFVDGVYKSSRLGEAASYESFVHPAMVVHKDPKKVLLFGAGAGTSIREVLKHRGVEEVHVVGADRSFLSFAREHLQEWNDCSDFVGSIRNCLDDSRVNLHFVDPGTWLSKYKASKGSEEMSFDIAMVDFL